MKSEHCRSISNPIHVITYLRHLVHRALQASPNAAHVLLAKLSIPSVLRQVAPAAESYHLVTQNVDGLSPRAMDVVQGESKEEEKDNLVDHSTLIEMHGQLFELKCTKCKHIARNFDSPLTPALGEADSLHASVVEAGTQEVDIPLEKLPRCEACGELARPNVVWFGEAIPLLPKINQLVRRADLCLVVGTSSTVGCSIACISH